MSGPGDLGPAGWLGGPRGAPLLELRDLHVQFRNRNGTVARAVDGADLAVAMERHGLTVTAHPDGSVHTDATAAQVGQIALAAGVALTELRAADGAGLEEMFLELTADTAREGAAA